MKPPFSSVKMLVMLCVGTWTGFPFESEMYASEEAVFVFKTRLAVPARTHASQAALVIGDAERIKKPVHLLSELYSRLVSMKLPPP